MSTTELPPQKAHPQPLAGFKSATLEAGEEEFIPQFPADRDYAPTPRRFDKADGEAILERMRAAVGAAKASVARGEQPKLDDMRTSLVEWKEFESRYKAQEEEDTLPFLGNSARIWLAELGQSLASFFEGPAKFVARGELEEREATGKMPLVSEEARESMIQEAMPYSQGLAAVRGGETVEEAQQALMPKASPGQKSVTNIGAHASHVIGFLLGPMKVTAPIGAAVRGITALGKAAPLAGTAAQFFTERLVSTGDLKEAGMAAAMTPIYAVASKLGGGATNLLKRGGLPPSVAGALGGMVEGLGFAAMDVPSMVKGARLAYRRYEVMVDPDLAPAEKEAKLAEIDQDLSPILEAVAGSMLGVGLIKGMQVRRAAHNEVVAARLKKHNEAQAEQAKVAAEKEAVAAKEKAAVETQQQTQVSQLGSGMAERLDVAGFLSNPKNPSTFDRPGFESVTLTPKGLVVGGKTYEGREAGVKLAELEGMALLAALHGRQLLRHQGIDETMTPGVFWSRTHGEPVALGRLGDVVTAKGTVVARPELQANGRESVMLDAAQRDIIDASTQALSRGRVGDGTVALWNGITNWMMAAPQGDAPLVRAVSERLAQPAIQAGLAKRSGPTVKALARFIAAGTPIEEMIRRDIRPNEPVNRAAPMTPAEGAAPPEVPPPGEVPRGTPEPEPAPRPKGSRVQRVMERLMGPGFGFSEWLADRLERVGGPKAQEFVRASREITSEAKGMKGKLRVEGGADEALKAVGRPGLGRWLSAPGETYETPSGQVIVRRTRLLEKAGLEIPPSKREGIELFKTANLAGGEMGGVAKGEIQRFMTAGQMDMIRAGGAEHQALVDAFTAVNPKVTRKEAADLFASIKADMDAGKPGVIRKIGQEYRRLFEQVPSAIKRPGRGWVELYHDTPHDYLKQMIERVPERVAFKKRFPDEGLDALVAGMKEEMPSGSTSAVTELIRAHHGLPKEMSRETELATRVLRLPVIRQVFGTLALSGSAVVNALEFVAGLTPRSLGWRNYLRGAKRLFGPGGKEMRQAMELHGDVNMESFDWSLDPKSPWKTALRYFRNAGSIASGNNFLNETIEKLSAATGKVVSERMQAGVLGGSRVRWTRMLTDFGFTEAEAGLMVEGRGSSEMYARFERSVAGRLTGGNRSMVESSRLQTSRAWSAALPFMSYPIVQAQKIVKPMQQMFDPAASTEIRQRAAVDFVKQMGWTAASGAAIGLVMSMLRGGKTGASIYYAQAKDEPVEFFGDAVLRGLGGPVSMIAWAAERASEEGNVFEAVGRSVFPLGVTADIAGLLGGFGPYQDKDWMDRASMFARRWPAGRILSTWVGSAAFGNEDPGDTAARSAYYEWTRDHPEIPKVDVREGDTAFRQAMGKAQQAMRDDEDPWPALAEAFNLPTDVKDPAQRVRTSLLNRRLLNTLDDGQLSSLRARIGEDAFQRLVRQDAVLLWWADSVK